MKNKYIFLLLFIHIYLQANSLEKINEYIQEAKDYIKKEEMTAKAQEKYFLKNYKLAKNITELKNEIKISAIPNYTFGGHSSNHKSFPYMDNGLNSREPDFFKNLNAIKIYQSNIYRNRTYFDLISKVVDKTSTKYAYKIHLTFKDEVAKILLEMYNIQDRINLKEQSNSQFLIGIDSKNNRGLKNHLSVYNKKNDLNNSAKLLYYVHKDKILEGPYTIDENMLSTYNTNKILYDFIPNGVLIYDLKGKKYTKTLTSIEELK